MKRIKGKPTLLHPRGKKYDKTKDRQTVPFFVNKSFETVNQSSLCRDAVSTYCEGPKSFTRQKEQSNNGLIIITLVCFLQPNSLSTIKYPNMSYLANEHSLPRTVLLESSPHSCSFGYIIDLLLTFLRLTSHIWPHYMLVLVFSCPS